MLSTVEYGKSFITSGPGLPKTLSNIHLKMYIQSFLFVCLFVFLKRQFKLFRSEQSICLYKKQENKKKKTHSALPNFILSCTSPVFFDLAPRL